MQELCASVAQLDRAFGSDPEGRWFESSRAHHGVAAEARPTCPPLSRGALPLYKILAGTWSPKYPKCFTPPWRGRQGTPYKAPSKEGALPLYKILATAWSPKYPKCFTPTNKKERKPVLFVWCAPPFHTFPCFGASTCHIHSRTLPPLSRGEFIHIYNV